MKKPEPQPIIRELLSRGVWYAPHEIRLQLTLMGCHVSAEATTARVRDLRKLPFGRHKVVKRKRTGTDYYEYKVELQKCLFEQAEQRAA